MDSASPPKRAKLVNGCTEEELAAIKVRMLQRPPMTRVLPLYKTPKEFYDNDYPRDAIAFRANCYKIVERKMLNTGAYGTVRLAHKMDLNVKVQEKVAIKTYKLTKMSSLMRYHHVPMELEIASTVSHPNIVGIRDHFTFMDRMYLVADFASGGDLHDYITEHGCLNAKQAAPWFVQLTNGLHYLHNRCIAHRDVKLENILIHSSGRLMHTDFGLSRSYASREIQIPNPLQHALSSTWCGTHVAWAPEQLEKVEYNPFMADVWALGVAFYELLTDRLPFGDDATIAVLAKKQARGLPPMDKRLKVPKKLEMFVRRLMRMKAIDRPTIAFVVQKDSWFASHRHRHNESPFVPPVVEETQGSEEEKENQGIDKLVLTKPPGLSLEH